MALFQVLDDTKGAGQCKSCLGDVTWFEMARSGKRMPFDGDPVYVKTELRDDRRLVGFIDGHINPSHFATCPQSGDWRRR